MSRSNSTSNLVFQVATGQERDQFLRLRRDVYLDTYGHDGIDELDAAASHLVALDSNRQVVAGLRIIDSSHRPFDLEQFMELPSLATGRRPGEVGRFCVSKEYRWIQKGQFVHLGLFRLLYTFANEQGITDLFTLGLPILRGIYRLVLFRDTGITCHHPVVDQRVHLMHLDIQELNNLSTSGHRVARLLFDQGVNLSTK